MNRRKKPRETHSGFIVNGIRRKIGDTWRSDTVTVCYICKSASNKYVLVGLPVPGPRFVCPSAGTPQHDMLEDLLEQKDDKEMILRVLRDSYRNTSAEDRMRIRTEIELRDINDDIKVLREALRREDIVSKEDHRRRGRGT
jgi:hypothetical protein